MDGVAVDRVKLRNTPALALVAVLFCALSFALVAFPKNPTTQQAGDTSRPASAQSRERSEPAAVANSQPSAQPSAQPSEGARVLFDAANRERSAAGVAALNWDAALARAAQGHAELLAKGQAFEHQLPGEPNLAERADTAGAHFSYISENIAEGPDPESLHVGWMHSPGHRSNLLNPKVNAVGIAVVARGKQLYAVEDFARIAPVLSLAEQEKKISALLAAEGWKITDAYGAEARRVCAGASAPRLNMSLSIMHFETSDVDQLPASVDRDLRNRRPGSASVGACSSRSVEGFTQYRLAVLLY